MIAVAGIGGLGAFLVVPLLLFLVPSNSRDNDSPTRRAEMERIVREVGRLATFPVDVTQSIRTEGNSFARGFVVDFCAAPNDIDRWQSESPGLAGQGLVAAASVSYAGVEGWRVEVHRLNESCVHLEAWSG